MTNSPEPRDHNSQTSVVSVVPIPWLLLLLVTMFFAMGGALVYALLQ